MTVQAGLCHSCLKTALLVFPRGGSFNCYFHVPKQMEDSDSYKLFVTCNIEFHNTRTVLKRASTTNHWVWDIGSYMFRIAETCTCTRPHPHLLSCFVTLPCFLLSANISVPNLCVSNNCHRIYICIYVSGKKCSF